jgi:predicted RNA binding protein YcfA (HicA-like mRNA interferase family)
LLAQYGFVETRQRGSHVIMQKRTADTTITVPVPLHAEIRIGTLQSIIRQSRLPREHFEAQ